MHSSLLTALLQAFAQGPILIPMTPGTLQTPPPPLPAQFLSAITEPPLVIMVLACPTPPICGAANLRCCQSAVLSICGACMPDTANLWWCR